jgi:hypothetical protein
VLFRSPALGATKLAPALAQRGQRVLQYHRTPSREGWLSADLDQRPAWFKLVVILFAMALCAAISWFVFSGTTILRERAQPEPTRSTDAPAESAR